MSNSKIVSAAQDVLFKYPRFSLGPLHFTIRRGDRIALIGANGSGKTTLLNMLAGLKKPTRGRFEVHIPKSRIALLSDNVHFPYHWTLTTCVQAYLEMRASKPIHIQDPIWHKTTFAEGSKGMKVQALLKGIEAQHPDFLVCDEPSSGLDPSYQQKLLQFLNSYSETLIMSTHYFSEMQKLHWTQTWLMKGGQLQIIPIPSTPDEWEHAFGLI